MRHAYSRLLFTVLLGLGVRGIVGAADPPRNPYTDPVVGPQIPYYDEATRAKLQPKNIIVMISDGCGYNHIAAADLYQSGKTDAQVYEQWDRLAMATYPAGSAYDPERIWKSFAAVKEGATDSAAAATAMACGLKTKSLIIGMDPNGKPVLNIVEQAEFLGKATGVVTSVSFCDATPAAFVAHSTSRYSAAEICFGMIYQSAVDVIMGAGHPAFDQDGRPAALADVRGYGGPEGWAALTTGRAGGDADGDALPDPWTFIETRKQFQDLATGPAPRRVFGLAPVRIALQQERAGDKQAAPKVVPPTPTVPTLTEMTKGALNVLGQNPKGFFLMVEGGAVDRASHGHQTGRMIEEEMDFNHAVEAVAAWVPAHGGWHDTLVIVTGDHETGYLTGPQSGVNGAAQWNPLLSHGAGQVPGLEWHAGDHTNSLLPLFIHGDATAAFLPPLGTGLPGGTDPVRGRYVENTAIALVCFGLWRAPGDEPQ